MRSGGGIQEFRDCGRGLSSRTGDSHCRLALLLCHRLVLLQLGSRNVTQLLYVQHESILVLGDDYVVALQQTVVQFEFILCSFGLLALVLLGCCRVERIVVSKRLGCKSLPLSGSS